MDRGKMLSRDRQSQVKPKKSAQNIQLHGNQSWEYSTASSCSLANANGEGDVADMEVSLKTILAEIKSFQQDNNQQLGEIKEEISKTKLRLDEAEERTSNTEEMMQSLEEVMEG